MSGGIAVAGGLLLVAALGKLLLRAIVPRPRVYVSNDSGQWFNRAARRAPRDMGGHAGPDTRAERWPRKRRMSTGLRAMLAVTAVGLAWLRYGTQATAAITRYTGHRPHIPEAGVVTVLIGMWLGWSLFRRRT